ncbi:hypothetical protein HU200_062034 [Digitaria exilis]|uniref:AP2/ERF domain-containing protein n=1 Tax=Digitaria exilis TaxID=1010633 RepID=A0A835A9Q3_9POAL|nr:hypothetical protein HU200_062034 [Digitaria exilis]CAB3481633.1 unnamed protein product [Digitaria exilis]
MDYFKSAAAEPPGSTVTSSEQESIRASSERPSPPKRPAGRTKFQETRHPVYRGVRRRGRAGRWVCEVRVPGSGGERLWVGTFDTAEAAARAHDAAMLALCGAASASLNFPDSAWLLDVVAPASNAAYDLPGVQRAATEAVAAFLRRHCHGGGDAQQPPTRNAGSASGTHAGASGTPATTVGSSVVDNGGGGMVELDAFGGMDVGSYSYYASLAQGLLIDPPPPSAVECPEEEEEDCGAGEVKLWS